MQTATPTTKPATLIIEVLKCAAAASPIPVQPEELLDLNLSRKDDSLRARLASLACHRLHRVHGISVHILAKALRLDWSTISSRLLSANKLIRADRWSNIYNQLP
jgi:hypothetical protein